MGLRGILEKYRAGSASEREKDTYFERLTKIWLQNAPTQRAQFSRVMMFADWARENRFDQRDTGIDLVSFQALLPRDHRLPGNHARRARPSCAGHLGTHCWPGA